MVAGKKTLKSIRPTCYRCKHFLGSPRGTCKAFPERKIPEEIWSGEFQHLEPFPGDNGVRFEVNVGNEYLTISEVASALKVNPKTIYRAVWSNKIPAYKVGKSLRIAKKDLELFKKS